MNDYEILEDEAADLEQTVIDLRAERTDLLARLTEKSSMLGATIGQLADARAERDEAQELYGLANKKILELFDERDAAYAAGLAAAAACCRARAEKWHLTAPNDIATIEQLSDWESEAGMCSFAIDALPGGAS